MDRMRDAVLLVNGLGTEAPVGLRELWGSQHAQVRMQIWPGTKKSPGGCEGHPSVVFSLYRDPVSKGFITRPVFIKISDNAPDFHLRNIAMHKINRKGSRKLICFLFF